MPKNIVTEKKSLWSSIQEYQQKHPLVFWVSITIIGLIVLYLLLFGAGGFSVGERVCLVCGKSLLEEKKASDIVLISLTGEKPRLAHLLKTKYSETPTDPLTNYFCKQLMQMNATNMTLIYNWSQNATIGNYTGKLGGVSCYRDLLHLVGTYDCICLWAIE